MARNGDSDDEFYGDPTEYANYGGAGGEAYSEVPPHPEYGTGYGYPPEYGQLPPPLSPAPWYRKPAALIGFGALAVVVAALVIYAIVQLTGGSSSTTETTTTTPTSSRSDSVAPVPGQTLTVTETPSTTASAGETTTAAPSTTEATTTAPSTAATTTPPPSVSTSTVTETVTPSRTFPTLFPRPGAGQGNQGGQ